MQRMRSTIMARRLASGAVLAVLLASAAGSHVGAQEAERGQKGKPGDRRPLVLQKLGSFFVGGRTITAPGAIEDSPALSNAGQSFPIDALYAQFLIPQNPRRYPLVMVHGGGQTGKTWESTPDGREGYQTIFARRGWTTYVVDFPRRGKAGFPSFNGPLGNLEGEQIIPDTTFRVGNQNAFTRFRLGVWDEAGRRFYPNTQFPQTEYAVQQYVRQAIPFVQGDPEVVSDALAALFRRIGPGILLTHSQSGRFGWLTALKVPRLVKGIVAYEPAGANAFVFPEGEVPPPIPLYDGTPVEAGTPIPVAEFQKLTRMPMQLIYGDQIAEEPTPEWNKDRYRVFLAHARSFAAAVNRHGGDAQVLHLPEAGLHGNTHFPFSDLNNVQVANLMSQFLHRKGLDRRGRAAASTLAGEQ